MSALHRQFADAVYRSIGVHCAGVLREVPVEEIDSLEEGDVVLALTQYVLTDVMTLGQRIMCWGHVVRTVQEAITGALESQKEAYGEWSEEASEE